MVKQAEQQKTLHRKLWAIANDLRGTMDAHSFKDYILGLIFYRYLSENLKSVIEKQYLKADDLSYEEAWDNEEYKNALKQELTENSDMGYLIPPKFLYSNLVSLVNTGEFDVSMLQEAIHSLQESTMGHASQSDFEGLFDDMDLRSSKLGKSAKERTKLISKVILSIDDIDLSHQDADIDVLGDAYEYMIGKFAASAGKKAGEFYTPQTVSEILARIVTLNKTEIRDVYDPTCGSGSLLLRLKNFARVGRYYGQEKNSTTYNLARMNMMLHGIPFHRFDIHNGDTIEEPAERHQNLKFEAVVANPPYSQKWSKDDRFRHDERFSAVGELPPKTYADYLFIEHMIHHLDDKGTMGIVLPHGVLFRQKAEKHIRTYLIKNKNYLDAVIGLPANIFFGTNIPTVILIFKKRKETKDVLFVDASHEFKKEKNQNVLLPKHIEKIVSAYEKRENMEKYSHVAKYEDIATNDFNLNIPRYVDTFEEDEPVDLEEVRSELDKTEEDIESVKQEINAYLKELNEPELK